MYCTQCGKKQVKEARFCMSCGAQVRVVAVEKKVGAQIHAPKQKGGKSPRYYIKKEGRYYTECDNWSWNQKNGIYFSNYKQAENVIRIAHLKGAIVDIW